MSILIQIPNKLIQIMIKGMLASQVSHFSQISHQFNLKHPYVVTQED